MFSLLDIFYIEHRTLSWLIILWLPSFLYLQILLWHWAFKTPEKGTFPNWYYNVADKQSVETNSMFYVFVTTIFLFIAWAGLIGLIRLCIISVESVFELLHEDIAVGIIILIPMLSILFALFVRLIRSQIRKRIQFFRKLKND